MDESIPITPQKSQDAAPLYKKRLSCAIHVLDTEARGLSNLANLYDTDPIAQGGFNSAVEAIIRFKGHK
jgi:hypothetical protein